jgi:hypothetical protein
MHCCTARRITFFRATAAVNALCCTNAPTARAFARKRSRDDGDAQAPDFDLVDARVGYREGVRRNGAQREVYVQRSAMQAEQADPLQLPADGVIRHRL